MTSLAVRSTASERMDTDCTGYEDYARCLRDLARVNAVTGTYGPTLAWLDASTQDRKPGDNVSVLDVASGHGDMLRRIARWAAKRGFRASLTGIDLNPWATRAAEAATADHAIRFETGDVFAMDPSRRFDFIVSSQFTHHLTDAEIVRFIAWMERSAVRGWLISDLHRHWFAYYGFPLLARIAFWHRFVRTDGQISIARGFRPQEWPALVASAGVDPAEVRVSTHPMFRLRIARLK